MRSSCRTIRAECARLLRPRDLVFSGCILVTVIFACTPEPTSPGPPGILHAVLLSPEGPEGSAVLELTSTGLGEVMAVEGQVFARQGVGVVTLVVVLDKPGEIAFRMSVADIRSPPTVTVLEVADGDDQVRETLAGYEVEFDLAETF